jgi:predicted xylose isomerase-like sugar epimerase
MSSNETNSKLEAMSAAIRAATKLTNEEEKSEELTPQMLASAIKLAALSTSHQETLTSASVNAAIKFAQKSSNQEEQPSSLTPESLAIALKLATKVSSNDNDNKDTDEVSPNQMLAAMKAAVLLTQKPQTNELVTPELLSDALKLAKE